MARDERLKKVQGVGADFLETARARAEEFLRELSRAGGDTSGRAQGTLDDLVEGGRKGTEQLVSVIRKEITNQLRLLGVATKDDLAALERRLSSRSSAASSTGTTRATAARKTAEATKTTASKTTASKSTATGSTASKATAPKTAPRKAAARKAAQ